MSRSGTILWKRLDRPGHESAKVSALGSNWQLTGTALFAHETEPCRLNYEIKCDRQWRTTSTTVSGWLGENIIDIRITVADGHEWFKNEQAVVDVSGCIDVDLNFSPSTNLLPIRRLNLSIGQEAQIRAAWLRFPSFRLEPLEQIYRRIDANTYRYESAGGKFVAHLVVNDVGFVTVYPNVWQCED